MVGIIGAMSIETDALIEKMQERKVDAVGEYSFYHGKICGKDAVVCRCGVGKVAASSAAVLMAYLFNPKAIINIGVAGGVKPLKQGDIVVAEHSVQHDYDGVADGLELGQVHGYNSPYFECDRGIVGQICQVLDRNGYAYKTGTMATGDCFVSNKDKAKYIAQTFGAISFDMETAAINQVCQMQGIRFCAMRAISDNGDDTAVKSFYEFLTEASQKSIDVITEFIATFA